MIEYSRELFMIGVFLLISFGISVLALFRMFYFYIKKFHFNGKVSGDEAVSTAVLCLPILNIFSIVTVAAILISSKIFDKDY